MAREDKSGPTTKHTWSEQVGHKSARSRRAPGQALQSNDERNAKAEETKPGITRSNLTADVVRPKHANCGHSNQVSG
ncbi:hypothetical protein R1flu_022995 [Riccia fluitans]|uniref:Uncharacterized protein n=1 Tax=Riccia fluitans TaxID=41844 RepID=A0ABD1XQS2_9MARC